MPAQNPINGNNQGEQNSSSSSSFAPFFQNKIPHLNSKSRSFFLFLGAGAAIIGIVVTFFLLADQVEVTYPKKGMGPNDPAAIVNGANILNIDYQEYLDSKKIIYSKLQEQADSGIVSNTFKESLSDQALKELIQEKLLTQYLAEKDAEVTEDEVNKAIQEIVDEQFKGDLEAYKSKISELGSTLEQVSKGMLINLQKKKVIELENIEPQAFDNWYSDLLEKSDIEINSQFSNNN